MIATHADSCETMDQPAEGRSMWLTEGSPRTRARNGGVLLVHPGKQHAYEVALALQRVGQLREFVTGLYYKPGTFPYSVLGYLPGSVRRSLLREFAKRTAPDLSTELIQSWPYAEIVSRTVGRIPWVYRLSRGRSGYPFVNKVAGLYVSRRLGGMHPRPAAIYGFLGAAREPFARARGLGIPTVLDVPIVLDMSGTLRQEYRSLGLSASVPPSDSKRLNKELELADWVVAPSPAVRESVKRAGFAGRGIFVVPFGADPAIFKPAAGVTSPRPFRVVFAGRLEVRKGLHYLLEAWKAARLKGELILAGSPGEEEFVARMRKQYAGLFVEAGNLIQSELAALLSTSDVFVLPSLAEGSALVIYQALASGLPCIVSSEAGSVVRDGVEGFVIPARDSRALRERLERLYHDRDLRERMAEAAIARSREFAWDRYHRELISVIAVVLGDDHSSVTVMKGRGN